METQKKQLTRVRLINWHYFENETLSFHGSTLVSGENTAGKSTILDAIQLVLTTNTRKFNVAANEKGNRDLRGYVRCKIGNIGETYLRKDSVISNIALEFYEEKTEKYFVLGVHLTSPDEESTVAAKWYAEECRLEALSFLTGQRPSLAEEFQINHKRIRYIEQKNAARDRFKRRMGNLEDRFFDIIPKSLAFKPMDNVKDFINKFVLSSEKIDVAGLRVNIETLSELEDLMEKSKTKLTMLSDIVGKYEEIRQKDNDILVNEFLLSLADIEYLEQEIERFESSIALSGQYQASNEMQLKKLGKELKDTDDALVELKVAANMNEAKRLVENAERRITELKDKISDEKKNGKKLEEDIKNIAAFLNALEQLEISLMSKAKLQGLLLPEEPKKKTRILQNFRQEEEKVVQNIRLKDTHYEIALKNADTEMEQLQKKLRDLENRILEYPRYTRELKKLIEEEFRRRSIDGKVYVVCELLEIMDEEWRNAVEGYFHTQKFNLIVEPEYYNIALSVYHRNQKDIHTAGLVNTKNLELQRTVDNQSLAYVVHSENRYAKAYSDYVLGRVMRCEKVEDLELHKIAMTAGCMLYQGYVVRNLDKETYKNPFIGQNAYRTQIVNTKKELQDKSARRKEIREEKQTLAEVLIAEKNINLALTETYADAPYYLAQYEEQLKKAEQDKKEAGNDPTLIDLELKIAAVEEQKSELTAESKRIERENIRLANIAESENKTLKDNRASLSMKKHEYEQKSDESSTCKLLAEEKYRTNRKGKEPKTILDNFSPQKAQFNNDRNVLLNEKGGLRELQEQFNHKFEQDFLRGTEGIRDYIDAKAQLESVEMIRFEEQMKKAKEDCEEVFKSDFLAKMRNNIENARSEFRNLNKALQNIYYGEDSYRFLITFDKRKESLYKMITSENNVEGFSLWTQAFETEYKEEMAELFEKLVTKDDKGDKIIEEYTDYRSYLDYDIEIHKKNGTVQKFSDIYGEKSGSETQVPYYVAIAASFYQLYRLGNSVRLMLLDEAFDKMDDERINSMMDFFNSLNLQVIMATPPAKIEVIGEKVGTILTAIRVGTNSIVEEYDL